MQLRYRCLRSRCLDLEVSTDLPCEEVVDLSMSGDDGSFPYAPVDEDGMLPTFT
jgi:hypothetical protein